MLKPTASESGRKRALAAPVMKKLGTKTARTQSIESERGPMNAWGRGCGECPACALRKRGYEMWTAKKA